MSSDPTSAALAGLIQIAAPFTLHRSSVGLVKGTQPTMRERLVQMDIPRAFIFGEKSLPDPDWNELAGQGVQVLVVANAGHGMAWENPCGVAEALITALSAKIQRQSKDRIIHSSRIHLHRIIPNRTIKH